MSKKTVPVVLDEETQKWLRLVAKLKDRSVSSLVRTIIAEYRERTDQEGEKKEKK